MTDDDGSTGPAGGVMFGPVLVHSAREALDRFELVQGDGDAESRACVMTAISWMTGEAWSDAPSCAHPVLRSMTISANDAEDTSPEDRAAILLAGETGLVDTWWLPATVVAAAMARPCPAEGEELPDETAVERVLRTLAAVSAWKELGRPRPDLQGADLQGAYLRRADLQRAYLRRAYLRRAYLRRAYLQGAYLQGAYLQGAYLQGAYLQGADLQGADLQGAYLQGAYLQGADLQGADLQGADLQGARAWASTVLPEGWQFDESTGLVVRASEVAE